MEVVIWLALCKLERFLFWAWRKAKKKVYAISPMPSMLNPCWILFASTFFQQPDRPDLVFLHFGRWPKWKSAKWYDKFPKWRYVVDMSTTRRCHLPWIPAMDWPWILQVKYVEKKVPKQIIQYVSRLGDKKTPLHTNFSTCKAQKYRFSHPNERLVYSGSIYVRLHFYWTFMSVPSYPQDFSVGWVVLTTCDMSRSKRRWKCLKWCTRKSLWKCPRWKSRSWWLRWSWWLSWVDETLKFGKPISISFHQWIKAWINYAWLRFESWLV